VAPRTPNPWVAIDSVSDRVGRARALRRAHQAFQESHDTSGLREVVAASWDRSGAAGIDPEGHLAPIVADERELEDRWRRHPLHDVVPVLRDLLGSVTTDARHMMVISDADGVVLWLEGHEGVIAATEEMHFVPGADWSEAGAGTNAVGTALALDHPVQIFSAEHYNRRVHPWQCSGAPIHDPETGAILGVLDLTGGLKTVHPHTLSLVTAAARMAEAFLRGRRDAQDARLRETYLARVAGTAHPTALARRSGRVLTAVPHDWVGAHVDVPDGGGEIVLPDGTTAMAEPLAGDAVVLWRESRGGPRATADPAPDLRLELLGPAPGARLRGERRDLSRRHAEILCLLALQPRGLTGEQLTLELYGEHGNAVTARAELSRLRRDLGERVRARPYRLTGQVTSDFAEVTRLVEQGRLGAALDTYAGPLLPFSRVPLVVEARERLELALRRGVVASGDTGLLERWCSSASGRTDQPAAELLLSLLPAGDPAYASATLRVARLRAG
jgi:hypothetical protein